MVMLYLLVSEGYGAFCCDNPSTLVSLLLRHSPCFCIYSSLQSDPLIEDFKRRISTFANNPTCTVRPPRRDVPANLSLSRMSDFEKRASLSNDDFTLLLQQLSQIARGGGTSRESLMASQFNLLYGDRYGLYIADLATFYADWYVLCPYPSDCTKAKEPGQVSIHSSSPRRCCAWGVMLAISCPTTIRVETNSA